MLGEQQRRELHGQITVRLLEPVEVFSGADMSLAGVEGRAQAVDHGLDDGLYQLGLALEVAVEAALGDAGGLADLVDGDALDAFGEHEIGARPTQIGDAALAVEIALAAAGARALLGHAARTMALNMG